VFLLAIQRKGTAKLEAYCMLIAASAQTLFESKPMKYYYLYVF
jgi:hypothetical protein